MGLIEGDKIMSDRLEKKQTKERFFVKYYIDFHKCKLFTSNEKQLFMALKAYIDFTKDVEGVTSTVFPSQDTLSECTGMSVSTIKRAMKGLQDKGVVKVKRQGLNKPNLYTIYDYACIWESETLDELAEVMKDPDRLDKVEAKKALDITDHIEEVEENGYEVMSKEDAARLRELEQRVKELEQAATDEPMAKEKPATGANPETSNQQQTDISFPNKDYKGNYTPSQDEKYSMDMIKSKYEYEYMLMDRPYEKGIIDSVFDYIYDTLNEPSEYVRVQRTRKPKKVVISRFMKLTRESILFVIDRYQAQINRIQYPKQYIITQLYEAPAQFEMDITNRVNHDLYGA